MSEKKVTQSWEEKAVELSQGKSALEAAKDAREIYTLDLKTEISAIKSAISKAEMQERKTKKEYEDSAFAVFQGDDAFKSYIQNRDNVSSKLTYVENNLKFLQDSLTYREEQLKDLVETGK